MASRIIAQVLVMGSGVVLRAISQAYRQAIVNAGRSGVAQETVQNMAHRLSKTMTTSEARLVLGVGENASWEEVLKRYELLFEKNAAQGSFYIQSKVQRAKECLEGAKQAS
eukprot:TRINITY_DN6010_c0_g1_i1.p1 TRINITY_DN6010_c0_g1~~TRINITY_DN6010_c0_g1_i1.p1  ORF type:complete len:111 (-),score=21.04 TRINITY_DN6010_c0_g1_i1:216-548(-)